MNFMKIAVMQSALFILIVIEYFAALKMSLEIGGSITGWGDVVIISIFGISYGGIFGYLLCNTEDKIKVLQFLQLKAFQPWLSRFLEFSFLVPLLPFIVGAKVVAPFLSIVPICYHYKNNEKNTNWEWFSSAIFISPVFLALALWALPTHPAMTALFAFWGTIIPLSISGYDLYLQSQGSLGLFRKEAKEVEGHDTALQPTST